MSDTVDVPEVATVTTPEAAEAAAKKVKGVCDIVFLMDTTGSMQPAINDLKKNIKLFFKSLSNGDENGNAVVKDWRARVIGYRDVKVDDAWFINNPFTRDVSEIGQLGKTQFRACLGLSGTQRRLRTAQQKERQAGRLELEPKLRQYGRS